MSLHLEREDNLGGLHLVIGERDVAGGAAFALGQGEDELVIVGAGQLTVVFVAVEEGDVERLADVFLVLAHFAQGGVETRRGHVELIVLLIAAQVLLDGAAQLGAVVNKDAVIAVYRDEDTVVGRNLQVHKELVAAVRRDDDAGR